MWYFLSMCFPFLWFLGSLDYATAPLLSQNNVIGTCSILTTPRSERNFLSQTASFATSQAATYSASMVEFAIQDCLTLLRVMAPPPKVKTHPEVDFWNLDPIESLNLYSQWNQILTPVNKHIIFRSLKILENMLYILPMFWSWIWLISADHANWITDIWSSTKHDIHETSYCKSIRNLSHHIFFFLSLRPLDIRQRNSMSKRK